MKKGSSTREIRYGRTTRMATQTPREHEVDSSSVQAAAPPMRDSP